jgi:uncharacterized coiled-coil protein SlyX
VEARSLSDDVTSGADNSLEARLIELEVRSEERRADNERLDDFVRGFENRIARIEKRLANLSEHLENPPDEMPTPAEDLPPHY